MNVRITWTSGLQTVESTHTTSVDAYAMERWGKNTAAEVEEQYGIKLEMTEDPLFSESAARKAKLIEESKANVAALK